MLQEISQMLLKVDSRNQLNIFPCSCKNSYINEINDDRNIIKVVVKKEVRIVQVHEAGKLDLANQRYKSHNIDTEQEN